jgi:hypothetical protein
MAEGRQRPHASMQRLTRQRRETTGKSRHQGSLRPQARPGVPFVPALRVTTRVDLLAMMGRDPDPEVSADSAPQ